MDHHDRARPLSGEIMSGMRSGRDDRPHRSGDATDAQYEIVAPRGDASTPARFPRPDEAAAGMAMLTADSRAIRGARPGRALFWSCGLSLAALAFWLAGGHVLVAGSGPAAGAAKPPLFIAAIDSRVEAHGGRNVLFVDGHAGNRGSKVQALPHIEIAVTANDGAVTRYYMETRNMELQPGDRYAFSSRLEAPGSGVKSVSAAFAQDRR